MTSTSLPIVYILVTSGRGRFATMALLSVRSAKRVHPENEYRLVCDTETEARLAAEFPELLREFTVVKSVALPHLPDHPKTRGMFLKSRMCDLVRGDFVFLDADTLVIRPFLDLPPGEWDFAAVQDRNHHCPIYPSYPSWRAADYLKLGWEQPIPRYFNTGVMFVRDTARTRTLSEEWQRRWHQSYTTIGEPCDQFTFNSAALACRDLKIHELDSRYNAMVRVHPMHAKCAKVYHFFAGNSADVADTILGHLVRKFDQSGMVDWPALERCAAMDHPWVPPYWPRRLWQTGNRVQAARLYVCKLFSGVFRLRKSEEQE